MLTFSIITVVKNNANGIEKTLNSLKLQTFQNYEHIIIDSNSTDNTSKVIKNKMNQKIVYIREEDKSIYEALNKAVRIAKGRFIGILHSGDFYTNKNILEIVDKNLYDNDFVFGNVVFYNKKLEIFRVWRHKIKRLSKYNSFKVPHTSMFINRKIFMDIGLYNIDYKISSDTDLILRIIKKNNSFKYLDEYLIFMESGGLSFSYKNYYTKLKEDLIIYFKNFKSFFIFMYLFKLIYKLSGIVFAIKKSSINNLNKVLKTEYEKL